jgi:hypothetical protein
MKPTLKKVNNSKQTNNMKKLVKSEEQWHLQAVSEPQIIVPSNDTDDETAVYFEEMLQGYGITARVEATFGEFEIYLTNPTDKRRATKVINDAGWTL